MSSGEDNSKCLEAQADEIEVLYSIYGDEWKTESESERSYSIEIKEKSLSVILYVTLPKTYPFETPPNYTISAPGMRREHKDELMHMLEEVYMQNSGQTVIYQWIDKIREYLSTVVSSLDIIEENVPKIIKKEDKRNESVTKVPEIFHGDLIIDRKSMFQGHVANIVSLDQVRLVLNELRKTKKIANAAHNISAYRIRMKETILQDCDDDGEANAGNKLLHLLQILNLCDVLVVVSRWFGGIYLGHMRFRHISNAARLALEEAKLIKEKTKKLILIKN